VLLLSKRSPRVCPLLYDVGMLKLIASPVINLSSELLEDIFRFLGPVTAICLGLSHPYLYTSFKRIYIALPSPIPTSNKINIIPSSVSTNTLPTAINPKSHAQNKTRKGHSPQAITPRISSSTTTAAPAPPSQK